MFGFLSNTVENTPAIVFLGYTGCGKSYFCNRIFKISNVSTKFKSTCSVTSVTKEIQCERIIYEGKQFNIIDSPGFYDTSANDGINMCNIIKALENKSIAAIVFMFTNRFSDDHFIWLKRIVDLATQGNSGLIILLLNKTEKMTKKQKRQFKIETNSLINHNHTQYRCLFFKFYDTDENVLNILSMLSQTQPFTLTNIKIPEFCYEKREVGREYTKQISQVEKDVGRYEEIERKNTYWQTDHEEIRFRNAAYNAVHAVSAVSFCFGILGKVTALALEGVAAAAINSAPKPVKWVTETVIDRCWVPEEVREVTTGTFVDEFKVRFDGTRDKIETREIKEKRRTERMDLY